MASILEGIRVVDLSRHMSGPYCSSLLADIGAEVIRVEAPGGDEDRRFGCSSPTGDSYAFINRMRNKKAITLNLRHPEGLGILNSLIKVSDIVLENFAQRDKDKFGLSYNSLSEINPSIILASISAFGLSGPNIQKTGFDPIAQAMSGAMAFNGFPENPPTRSAVAWVDYATAIFTAFGIMAAVRNRDQTGKGQAIDIALADVAAGLVALHGVYAEYEKAGEERPQMGNVSPHAYADSFRAQDGWVFISLTRDGIWKRFLKAVGMEQLAEDARFQSDEERVRHREALNEIVTPWVNARTADEVTTLLGNAAVPCQRINTISQAFSESQYKERAILVEMEHSEMGSVSTLDSIIKFSETPGEIRRVTPVVAQDNKEVYKQLLGFSDQEFNRLEKEGAI